MKTLLNTTALLLGGALAAHAQIIEFTGQTQNRDLTAHDWVLGSKMWGSIESGNAAGTSSSGFNSLSGIDIADFKWTFGDLELTSFQEPGAATPGFEVYSEADFSVVSLEFRYKGDLWASGTVDSFRVDVDHVNDETAIGSGVATLVSAGVDDAFFNEVMTLTGNSGEITFEVTDFDPVDGAGLFNTTGTLSAVPEPEEYAIVAGVALVLFAILRRRSKTAHVV